MKFRLLYRFLTIAAVVVAGMATGNARTMNVAPGTLSSLLGDDVKTTISLTLTGAINVNDLITMSQMPALRELNMRDVVIESLHADDPVYMSHRSFEANTIPEYMFFTSKVNTIVLPSTLTAIGEGAFAASALKEVTIPAGLKSIGAWGFLGCSALTTIQLPASVQTMGKGAFKNCTALKEMNLTGTALTALPDEAFMGCTALASVTFPAGLESIGEYCFTSTALTDIVIGPKVTSIGAYSLSSIPTLQTADLGTTATLGDGVLAYDGALTTLSNVPAKLPAMTLAASTQLVLDTTLTKTFSYLGDMALADNPTANYIFSETLIYVGNRVWDGADNLHDINVFLLGGSVPETADSALYGIKNIETRNLWVDETTPTPWEEHPQWSKFEIHRCTLSVDENLLPDDQKITFTMEGTTLVISALKSLKQVVVTDVNGMMIAAMNPGASEARVDLADRQGSVLIIKASTADATRTSKLTIRR